MQVQVISEASSFNGNLSVPYTRGWRLDASLKLLHSKNIGYVRLDPWVHAELDNCHNNVLRYIDWYGGDRIKGYYWLSDPENQRFLAISHSVLRTSRGDILDITPTMDQRESNLFSLSTQSPLELFSSSKVIYGFSFNFS